MKLSEAPDDQLIAAFVQLRDARTARKRAYEAEDENDKAKMAKLESELLRRLNERGTDSTSSREHGTAYRNTKTSCSVADPAEFRNFVIENEAWDFLENRANKTMVDQYKDEHGELPPGLNYSSVTTIGIRRN